jgi:hypothetical protein
LSVIFSVFTLGLESQEKGYVSLYLQLLGNNNKEQQLLHAKTGRRKEEF